VASKNTGPVANVEDAREMPVEAVFIGIGSNLTNPVSIVRDAILCLGKITHSKLINCSSVYQSEPISDIVQDDYVNAVVRIETSLRPTFLLLELQAIEHAFYRQRDPSLKWAPRTLDLDIVLYGNRIINDSHLVVPHPEMHHRLFVLKPLFEIAGEVYIPRLGSLSYLIDNAPAIDMHIIGEPVTPS
jgi:2-amino-4-hydroxy-6-hydroxymethyldihydropteridine diphosphokinase